MRIAKKGAGLRSVTAAEAIEVALCYGWIDSLRRALDADHFLQRYSPRRSGSPWSRINVERVEALIAAGRMRDAGLAEVEAARADGRWDAAYESQRAASVPADLEAALASDDRAREAFDALSRTGRYLLILPLLKARDAGARAALLRRALASLGGEGRRG